VSRVCLRCSQPLSAALSGSRVRLHRSQQLSVPVRGVQALAALSSTSDSMALRAWQCASPLRLWAVVERAQHPHRTSNLVSELAPVVHDAQEGSGEEVCLTEMCVEGS